MGENCLCALLLNDVGLNILDCLGENLGYVSSYISDLWRGIGLLRPGEKLLCLIESCGEGSWLNCLSVGWTFSCL